jgi:energy-coupling factor transporter ATP-binding protein EcfA2
MPNRSQAADTIETAHAKLLAVSAEWATAKESGQTDVISGLIKRILTEVLAWPLAELTDCKTPEAPFECIRLTIEGASRVAIIIQKKTLGLKDRNTDRPYRLDGPVLTAHETAEGIKQACIVCGLKNTELAVVTNGEEWIVFRGSRIGDGKDTLEGLAFVFPSLQAVKDTFKLFYDLLSREPVIELRYRAHFQEAEGQPIRARAFSKVLREQHQLHPLPPTPLAADLDRIMESFFMRLSGDKDPDMLLNCFITTRESKVAEDKIARISEDLVGHIRNLDTHSAETLSDMIHKVQITHRNEFVLLIGTKGAGKSTFIERFFKLVLPQEVKAECIFVNVDLKACEGSETRVIEWLDDTLLQKTEQAIFDDEPPTYEEIQGMFFDEYCRWRSGTYKHLYESNREQFMIEFGRHIEQWRETRPHEYIRRLMRSIVNSRKKAPCVVFDNADHFSIEFQEKVFQYAVQSMKQRLHDDHADH